MVLCHVTSCYVTYESNVILTVLYNFNGLKFFQRIEKLREIMGVKTNQRLSEGTRTFEPFNCERGLKYTIKLIRVLVY